MSDFLGRLTARHSADSSSPILPRAVSRFESPALSVERDLVEPNAATEAEATPLARSEPAPVRRALDVHRRDESAREQPARSERAAIDPPDRAAPVQARVEQILKQVETIASVHRESDERRSEPHRDPMIVATPTVPRIVPSTDRIPPPPNSVSLSHPIRIDAESTVIRVHIGRIEVRTAPQAVERPRARSAKTPEAPKPMSLERYLNGKGHA